MRDRIRIEIRAAEIASNVENGHEMVWNVHEMAGWMRYGDNSEGFWPKKDPVRWHSGWLAAIIWSHDKQKRYKVL